MSGYRLTHQAERDLLEIWAYIGQDNPDAADKVLTNMRAAFAKLGHYPSLGQHRKELRNDELRFLPAYSYLIAYRSNTDPVEIYRVLSSYRDIARELSE